MFPNCAQLIALIALALFVFGSRNSRIPDWSGDEPNRTSRFSRIGILTQGLEGGPELRGQVNVSYSQISPSTTAYTSTAMKNLVPRRYNTPFVLHFASSDCSGPTPTGYTRIFIAHRPDARPGTGTASDPFDGSTAQKFDALLRARSERGVTHLVVCIAPGTFETAGAHDYLIGAGHLNKSQPGGFTVNQGWRVHGAAMDQTVLKLTDLYFDPAMGKYLIGQIIGTYDLDSYGVEVSDLTLDANYPELKSRFKTGLQLQAIFLQSNRGQHWIHDLHVTNASGEVAESFPVEIGSQAKSPRESSGNIIEHVTMDHWGSGKCTAIAIVNAAAEVRYNTVIDYYGGYGGWKMADVHFHDNAAIDTVYGFNIDSWQNTGVAITNNQIVRPQSYGLVIGGIGQFSNFSIAGNTVNMAAADRGNTLYGLIFQGNVTGAHVIGNKISSDQSLAPATIFGFYEKGTRNIGNVFQNNQIPSFSKNSLQGSDCVYGNTTQNGAPLRRLRNSQNMACAP